MKPVYNSEHRHAGLNFGLLARWAPKQEIVRLLCMHLRTHAGRKLRVREAILKTLPKNRSGYKAAILKTLPKTGRVTRQCEKLAKLKVTCELQEQAFPKNQSRRAMQTQKELLSFQKQKLVSTSASNLETLKYEQFATMSCVKKCQNTSIASTSDVAQRTVLVSRKSRSLSMLLSVVATTSRTPMPRCLRGSMQNPPYASTSCTFKLQSLKS